jgi:hypothetical protein
MASRPWVSHRHTIFVDDPIYLHFSEGVDQKTRPARSNTQTSSGTDYRCFPSALDEVLAKIATRRVWIENRRQANDVISCGEPVLKPLCVRKLNHARRDLNAWCELRGNG